MLLIVINLFVLISLFTIYLSFLVQINSILSAGDSWRGHGPWVGRGRGPWEIVLPPQLENILEETLHTFNKIREMHLQR